MGVKSDRWIIEMATRHQMIDPFAEDHISEGISFGVSSYGYDFRLSTHFKIFDAGRTAKVDPKNPDGTHFSDSEAESILIPPNSFVLARSLEYFRIPRDVITICTGKSTYARSGVIVNVTPFEPEWDGYATISLANTAPRPTRVYANEGIAQLIFLEGSEICRTSYADKKGRYQSQKKITLSKMNQ